MSIHDMVEARSKILNYVGDDIYINKIKDKIERDKYYTLTKAQVDYVKNNYNNKTIGVGKVVEITEFFSNSLKEQFKLKIAPNKIYVDSIVSETDKAYNIRGKLHRNKPLIQFYVPKSQIIDDLFSKDFNYEELDIDFNEYISKTNKKLYKYQENGVKFMVSRDKCIMGDDMGLGKTRTAIVASLYKKYGTTLIVCPASLKYNWKKELSDYIDPDEISVINGDKWENNRYVIINYEILKNFHTVDIKDKEEWLIRREIVNFNFDAIIFDEAHKIKNPKAKTTIIIDDFLNIVKPKSTWLLTGTPMSNKPMDFFNLLKTIQAPVTDDWVYYAKRYCKGKQINKKLKNGYTKKIWLTDGASNLDELNKKTRNYLIRRLKTDELDLPDKNLIPVYYEFTKKERYYYDNLWEEYLNEKGIEDESEMEKYVELKDLLELSVLRKWMSFNKISYTKDLVNEYIEQGKKCIIFTNYIEEYDEFMNEYSKIAVGVDGRVKDINRQKAVEKFQNDDKVKVFVGNLKAAGVGLTLTKADMIIFNSIDWVPALVSQAIDRAYRIGKEGILNVYFPLFENSIDTVMWNSLTNKTNNINQVIGDNTNIFKDINK